MALASAPSFAGKWSSLKQPLTSWVSQRIQDLHYEQMTPVQASVIPIFMGNKDVVVEAVTGSGKTLAFVLPIIERLLRRQAETPYQKGQLGALIISPTRELASQIHAVFSLFLTPPPAPSSSLTDGTDSSSEPCPLPPPLLLISSKESTPAQDLARFLDTEAVIAIGTPGRVEEFLLGRRVKGLVRCSELEVLVMDEADRLLDLGFSPTLTKILHHLPKQRRTGLFSATMTEGLSELVRVGLRNPVRIVVKVESRRRALPSASGEPSGQQTRERRTPASLKNMYLACKPGQKMETLIRILEKERAKAMNGVGLEEPDGQSEELVEGEGACKFIVYMATCAAVDYFYRVLSKHPSLKKFTLFSLHGHLPPASRTTTLDSFSTQTSTPLSPSVLLCTDVAARGLDLPDVDMVIQYDPPVDPKNFSHRAGRTARAGRKGRALILLGEGREEDYVEFLNLRKIPLQPYPQSTPSLAASSSSTNIPAETSPSLLALRSILMQDRDLHDRSLKAFVSFLRAYSKHEAAFIFRIGDLDLGGLATDFGLLRMPGGPEVKLWRKKVESLKEKEPSDGVVHPVDWKDAVVDWDAYSYASKPRETQRLTELEEAKKNPPKPKVVRPSSTPAVAWSNKLSSKTEKEARKEKKALKRAREKQAAVEEKNSHQDKDGEGQVDAEEKDDSDGSEEEVQDWKELVRETKRRKQDERKAKEKDMGGMDFTDL
ncbi:dead-domain-containing protein [Phaffia rhodozyma]|uniref:ATP-dependent RNA helicase n=1 Tax=Phaffia rhodozyma TaxID=264483 RepID=A0A0F7SN63_PHARH|nr:dead-domain-containing protein [Phaffia rhodozyma]